MQDLSAYQCLTKLLLDFNELSEMAGLQQCHRLSHLSVSHNSLSAIRGLDNLPITVLNLSFNRIEKAAGLENVKSLRKLDLSRNKIHSLQGLQGHELLEVIDLQDNQVADVAELKWLTDLPLLRVVNLLQNPIQEREEYWLSAVFKLLQSTELDLRKITAEEKVLAVNTWAPPAAALAAQDHRTHLLANLRQPQRVLSSTLPSAELPYPLLVLLGPAACGKRELAFRLCRKFRKYFRFGPCHTTRAPYFGEENQMDYFFISPEEFGQMVEEGKFLLTYQYSGQSYGLARDTVESIARAGLASCVHLEIEGVLSLKNTYFRPKYILLVPKDKWDYEESLRRAAVFSRAEIKEAVGRVETYLEIHRDCPGYFDAVINTDDLEEAFSELIVLIKLLLGLEPPGACDNLQDTKSGTGSTTHLIPKKKFFPGSRTPTKPRSPSGCAFAGFPGKSHPRDSLDMLGAPPESSVRNPLQRRDTRQPLFWNIPGEHSQLFHMALAPPTAISHPFFLNPKPPDVPNVPQELKVSLSTPERRKSKLKKGQKGEARAVKGPIFVPTDPALAEGLQLHVPPPHIWQPGEDKAEQQELRGAGKDTSEKIQRKSSKSKLGSSPVPQLLSNSKPILPPIPPGWKST